MSKIAIIGAGPIGKALSTRLVETGYSVKVANSRGPDTLKEFAQITGASAAGIADVSSGADVLILALPLPRVADLPKSVISTLAKGAVVVDANNYNPSRDGNIPEIVAGLPTSQWVSKQLGVGVIKAFNTIFASRIVSHQRPKGDPHRVALPISGDDSVALAKVQEIVERLGFTAYDSGKLSESWRLELGQPVSGADPTVEEIPLLLQQANKKK
ncbi:unnamed protein product [Kuraishia capsulata CBS 1993]|uniref:Pyrroline-5-carboxylate reductase catalytic N-terminal domain-containing protein n=1 Tax=Kuraishia capsulata CBS 1993 TaxID=1382522 RepID=W6MVU2_9ASCO|nr:uncharacterized protein KUCA_T00002507001 [Kuraishia capsulata CBS 1993]CDK26535.1 unnamed protein product [Kuraishia capsulata CBS 1993]